MTQLKVGDEVIRRDRVQRGVVVLVDFDVKNESCRCVIRDEGGNLRFRYVDGRNTNTCTLPQDFIIAPKKMKYGPTWHVYFASAAVPGEVGFCTWKKGYKTVRVGTLDTEQQVRDYFANCYITGQKILSIELVEREFEVE